jgi:predicted alpha/beta-fold hydrolase
MLPDDLSIPAFEPPRWLSNGHVQTVLVPYFAADRGSLGERVSVPITGGMLAGRLHVARPANRACVLVLHGIAGTAAEPFVRLRLASAAPCEEGVLLHWRVEKEE